MVKKYIVNDGRDNYFILNSNDESLNPNSEFFEETYEIMDRLISKNKKGNIYYSLKNKYLVYSNLLVKKLK